MTVDAIGYGGAREPARLAAGCEGVCWSERVTGWADGDNNACKYVRTMPANASPSGVGRAGRRPVIRLAEMRHFCEDSAGRPRAITTRLLALLHALDAMLADRRWRGRVAMHAMLSAGHLATRYVGVL